jgi:uncharacterized protein YbjT (DUF2867 family)
LKLKLLLAGATGLVGRLLLQRLETLDDIESIDCVGRTKFESVAQKVTQHIAPTSDWPTLVSQLEPDVAISALGTTMRQAGSEDAFFAVDHDMVVAFARAASAAGARRFMMVSSVGAHAASRNFYLATKGKAEADAQAAGFDRVDIFRPGLLRGNRGGARRVGERLGILISPVTDFLTPFVLDHYRSIAAADVAASIAAFLKEDAPGTFIHENRAMWQSIAAR